MQTPSLHYINDLADGDQSFVLRDYNPSEERISKRPKAISSKE